MNSDREKTAPIAPAVHHKVLVVDDDPPIGKALGRILEREKLDFLFVTSGEQAIAAMEASDRPFSLIISDQRMPGMQGTEFLARAKEISPDTVRYLATGYSEMETIINAVNKGAIQRYISKPWDNDRLRDQILEGIALYEQHLESEKLFSLAKKQNARLYELNCELMERTKDLESQSRKLDQELQGLRVRLGAGREPDDMGPGQTINCIADWIRSNQRDQKRFQTLRRHCLTRLYDMFSDLALRNGMEMPAIHLGSQDIGGPDA